MANATSALRLSGMNSGLDTESIVNALTATTKNKINTNERYLSSKHSRTLIVPL